MNKLKYKLGLVFVLTLNFLNSATVFAAVNNFFTNAGPTQFVLKAPFSKIAEMKKTEPNFLNIKDHKFGGELIYTIDGIETVIPVDINLKGFSSLFNCDFPKLELKIGKNKKTIFSGNKKIDLNTHCADPVGKSDSDQYAFYRSMNNSLREVVAYKILKSLGLVSFETRAITVKYVDIDSNTVPPHASKDQYQAFFIEDKSVFMERNGFTEIFGKNDPFKAINLAKNKTTEAQYQFSSFAENAEKFDLLNLATIEMFQNLIANNDWFIKADVNDFRKTNAADLKENLWNMKIFSDANGKWFTIAQDFNLSALSFIEIAVAPVEVYPISRKFSSQLSPTQKEALKNQLESKRAEILQHLELLAADSEFHKIKTFISSRMNLVSTELSKK